MSLNRNPENFSELFKVIKEKDNFLLTTHKNCDGDGIGSEIALAYILQKLGKTVNIYNPDGLPENLEFIHNKNQISWGEPSSYLQNISQYFVVILDNHELERQEKLGDILKNNPELSYLIIDHHRLQKDRIQNKNEILFCKSDYSSTGELIYDFFLHIKGIENIELDYHAALALYVSIVSDTGNFLYASTSPRTHRFAAELLGFGINPSQVYQNLFFSFDHKKLLLRKELYKSLKVFPEEGLAVISVSRKNLKLSGTDESYSEGLVNEILEPYNIKASILFREKEGKKTSASLRSKGDIDVSLFASRYEGGGHKNAAGLRILEELNRAENIIISDFLDYLKAYN